MNAATKLRRSGEANLVNAYHDAGESIVTILHGCGFIHILLPIRPDIGVVSDMTTALGGAAGSMT